MKHWIVTYEYESKANSPGAGDEPHRSNVALRGIHPAVWLSRPPDVFRRYHVQRLLFFAEIDAETYAAIEAANYISCEDHSAREEPAPR